jgi:hypothetical protein
LSIALTIQATARRIKRHKVKHEDGFTHHGQGRSFEAAREAVQGRSHGSGVMNKDRRLNIVVALIGIAIVGSIYGVHRNQKAKERKRQEAVKLMEDAYARDHVVFSDMKIEKIADEGPLYAISVKATNNGDKSVALVRARFDLPEQWDVIQQEAEGGNEFVLADFCAPVSIRDGFSVSNLCLAPGQSILLGDLFKITYRGDDPKAPVLLPEDAKLFHVSVAIDEYRREAGDAP